jgi:hypothetical protein
VIGTDAEAWGRLILRHRPSISSEEREKTTKTSAKVVGRELKPEPHEQEMEA